MPKHCRDKQPKNSDLPQKTIKSRLGADTVIALCPTGTEVAAHQKKAKFFENCNNGYATNWATELRGKKI